MDRKIGFIQIGFSVWRTRWKVEVKENRRWKDIERLIKWNLLFCDSDVPCETSVHAFCEKRKWDRHCGGKIWNLGIKRNAAFRERATIFVSQLELYKFDKNK